MITNYAKNINRQIIARCDYFVQNRCFKKLEVSNNMQSACVTGYQITAATAIHVHKSRFSLHIAWITSHFRPLSTCVKEHCNLPTIKLQLSKILWKHTPASTLYLLTCIIIWLAPQTGKMTQIACCDWLPEKARRSHLAHSRLPTVSRKQNFPKNHIINPLSTKFVRSRWLDIGLVWPISSHLDLTLGQ